MSVGEENTECPLCMEPLEMDDINFFPCTCGYQICRFCWHRIRTDENGLCPACRKQYPEDPAAFKPLTEDELQRIKKERRQKDLQRKQKAAENRKHLANVRVVQRNLVFVVGLSQRLADPEVLKRHDYFGKFGKIHKVVINQSTSYAGAQGPSASAYVTYHRPEDALRAIQNVNNVHVDGRTLKASLGTTKYCSHFLRGAQCPKPDCMYLHELGEEAASFTKEEMQQGKHQEYEQRLYEQFMNSQNLTNHHIPPATKSQTNRKKNGSPQTIQQTTQQQQQQQPQTSSGGHHATSGSISSTGTGHPQQNPNKEAWPSLQPSNNGRPERLTNGNKPHSTHGGGSPPINKKHETQNGQSRAPGHHRNRHPSDEDQNQSSSKTKDTIQPGNTQARGTGHPLHLTTQAPATNNTTQPPPHLPTTNTQSQQQQQQQQQQQSPIGGSRRSPFENPADSMSLFSNGFQIRKPAQPQQHPESITTPEIPDTIPVSSSTDWQAAFGFTPSAVSNLVETHDDDLGFDPWDESSKALADLIEKESAIHQLRHSPPQNTTYTQVPPCSQPKNLPPGFTASHIGAYNANMARAGMSGSKMLGLMHYPQMAPSNMHNQTNSYHDVLSDVNVPKETVRNMPQQESQDVLRAMFPNINISFGAAPAHQGGVVNSRQTSGPHLHNGPQMHNGPQLHNGPLQNGPQLHNGPHHNSTQKDWASPSQATTADMSWDPAIVTSGNVTDSLSESPPHWMASLQNLTDDSSNHRLPFVQQFQFRGPSWPPQTQHPPPGFQTQLRPPTQVAETHKLAEGLQ